MSGTRLAFRRVGFRDRGGVRVSFESLRMRLCEGHAFSHWGFLSIRWSFPRRPHNPTPGTCTEESGMSVRCWELSPDPLGLRVLIHWHTWMYVHHVCAHGRVVGRGRTVRRPRVTPVLTPCPNPSTSVVGEPSSIDDDASRIGRVNGWTPCPPTRESWSWSEGPETTGRSVPVRGMDREQGRRLLF